jgi:hypothetical protein
MKTICCSFINSHTNIVTYLERDVKSNIYATAIQTDPVYTYSIALVGVRHTTRAPVGGTGEVDGGVIVAEVKYPQRKTWVPGAELVSKTPT